MTDDRGSATAAFGRHVDCLWEPNPAGQGRRARRGGRYRAFVPDPIAGRAFQLDTDAVAALNRATKALERLQHTPTRLATLAAVAQNLLRSESVASSRIEDVLISHKRLARAAHARPGAHRRDIRAAEVLGNVEAMKRAAEVGAGTQIGVEDWLRSTGSCCAPRPTVRSPEWCGRRRTGLGATPTTRCTGPSSRRPRYVRDLLEDLCRFAARDDLPPMVQAAIAHAQFETIHPFADGNGRTGRALIYAVLRRRGEVTRYIPPISLLLAASPEAYIDGLNSYRAGDANSWCELFATHTVGAAREAERLAEEIESLEGEWLRRLGRVRQDAAARRLIAALPEQPVLDSASAQRLTGRSHVAVNGALRQLQEAGILRRLNQRKWGRVWECDELLDLIEDFEESVRRSFPGA